MYRKSKLSKSIVSATAAAAITGGLGSAVYAAEIEEIYITGSHIKRASQADSLSPLVNVGMEEIKGSGIITNAELFRWLPINSGSGNQHNAQNGFVDTFGTANVNLRGLGIGSTLVLVNGKRQVETGPGTNDEQTFVDINALVPMIMVENIEILKDGAAATYGSDAVGGVVNFKTRTDFEGFEIAGNFQQTARADDHEDKEISAIWGTGNDTTHAVIAATYFERDAFFINERSHFPRRMTSGFGNPGTYTLLEDSATDPTLLEGTRLPDPLCGTLTGSFVSGTTCRFDYGPGYTMAPNTTRRNLYATLDHQLAEGHRFYAEFGYADADVQTNSSPSLPVLRTPAPEVSSTHPGNPFGADVAISGFRAVGDGLGEPGNGSAEWTNDNDTTRFVFGLEGELPWESWTYDVGYTNSENNYRQSKPDQISSRFDLGLAGLGGAQCNPLTGTPGVGDCMYFNPFGNFAFASEGDPEFNSPELLAWLNTRNVTVWNTELETIEGVISGDLFDISAGTVALALGYQRREDSRSGDLSDFANQEDLLFFIGAPDYSGDRTVDAYFGELFVPIFSNDNGSVLEAQIAVRYEDYDIGFDSTDPKVGLLYRHGDSFSARATWGTSFRAPSVLSLASTTSGTEFASEAFSGASFTFFNNTARPNPDLQPEEAESFNIGFTVKPLENLEVSLDYYNIQYEDRFVRESSSQLISADSDNLIAAGCTVATLFTPACQAVADPDIIRDPITGFPIRVFVERFNASSAETDGLDLAIDWFIETEMGTFGISNTSTYVLSFEIQAEAGGETRELVGRRNTDEIFARSMPELRSNTTLSWDYSDNHKVVATWRYISSYEETDDIDIDSWSTLDLQYIYNFEGFAGNPTQIGIGALNVFDEDPPWTFTTLDQGWDAQVHDNRGSMLFLNFNMTFQ